MTTIDTATLERLKWLQEQFTRMYDNAWVRLDGETSFRSARQELDDIVATAKPPATVAPQLVVMTAEQVESVVDRVVAAIPPATNADVIVTALTEAIEASDVAIIDAVAQTRNDVLAAMPKAAEPAAE